jgi:hypothetical protein
METLNNSKQLEKKVSINAYLDNFGNFNKGTFLASFFTLGAFIASIVLICLIILNQAIREQSLDYFVIGDIYQSQIIDVFKYFAINILGGMWNTLINWSNALIDIIQSQQGNIIPNISKSVLIKNQEIYLNQGQLLTVFISAPLTALFFIFTVLQTKYQLQLRNSQIVNYYVPIILIYWYYKRHYKNIAYVKLINKLRDININKSHHEKLIQKVFKLDASKYELKIIEREVFGFYHFTELKAVEKDIKPNIDKTQQQKKRTPKYHNNKKSND